MTPYEMASLDVARAALATNQNSTTVAFISAGIAAVALVASVMGAFIIYRQLRSQRWLTLLSFEQDMQARRREFDHLAADLVENPPSTLLMARFDTAKEGYLNAVDRLASSILNGEFPEKEMKQDYREFISAIVRDFPDQFRSGTSFRKTLRLYERWQD